MTSVLATVIERDRVLATSLVTVLSRAGSTGLLAQVADVVSFAVAQRAGGAA